MFLTNLKSINHFKFVNLRIQKTKNLIYLQYNEFEFDINARLHIIIYDYEKKTNEL